LSSVVELQSFNRIRGIRIVAYVANRKGDRNKTKLDQYIRAVLYPTYENVKKALKSIIQDPSTIPDDNIEDYMNRITNTKYGFMSMLLAGDYPVSDRYR
jgi:hypothetical protein